MPRVFRLRRPALLLGLVLLSAPLRVAFSQRGPVTRPRVDSTGAVQPVPRWSFWLQNSWAGAELLALLFAAYQLYARRGERRKVEAAAAIEARKASNYQAWTVVNSAQGKGGSGGRIDALQDLTSHGISLAGVRLDGAWLEGVKLDGARLSHASFREANLSGATFVGANLEGADFTGANLTGADLSGALLKSADLTGAQLGTANIREADLLEIRGWDAIKVVSYLRIDAIRRPPQGFRQWALDHGAVEEDRERTNPMFSTHFRLV